MQNQPLIDKKDFKDLLEEIQKFNKIDLVAQALQTKYAREVAGDDNDKREKQLDDVNKNLEELIQVVKSSFKGTSQSGRPEGGSTQSKEYSPISKIQDDRPTTLKEGLKSTVAGVKGFGSSVMSSIRGLGAEKRTPSGDLKAAGGFLQRVAATGKDILSTSKEYTVEGARFAEAGGLSESEGIQKFSELQAKEEEIDKTKAEIKRRTDYGFEATPEQKEKLEAQKQQYIEADPRSVGGGLETPSDKIIENTEEQTKVSKNILKKTEESVKELKNIATVLGAKTNEEPAQQQSQGGGIGSMIGDAVGGAASAGVGGKILGGLGTAAKAVGGALLSKPALIAGGVALAGYGAYKGYQAIKGAFGGGDNKPQQSSGQSQGSFDERVQAKLNELPQNMRNDPDVIQNIQEEVEMEMKSKTPSQQARAQQTSEQVAIQNLQDSTLKNEFGDQMAKVGAYDPKTGSYNKALFAEKDPEGHAQMMSRLNEDKQIFQNVRNAQKKMQGTAVSPVTQKAGFGDKLKSMFSGVKDTVTGALGTAGAAIGGLKDKAMATAQYVSEEYNRDISASAAKDKLEAEADKRIAEQGIDPMSQEAFQIREQVREEMVAKDPNAFMMSEQMVGSKETFNENNISVDKKYDLTKDKMQSGITAQKSLFGSTFLGSLFSKEGQKTGQFLSERSDQEVLLANAAELGVGSDLPVEYKKRDSSTLLGERISSGSIFKRDKYKVSNTTTGQDLEVTKGEYKKLEALVAEGKAEEAQKLFDEINAREAAYVPGAGVTPEEQMVAPSRGSSNLAAVKSTSTENAAMKDEMAATSGTTQPIVSNNVSNTSTNNFIPIKGEPRATHRGSALERYNERVAAY